MRVSSLNRRSCLLVAHRCTSMHVAYWGGSGQFGPAALVALGKHLGMFAQPTQKTNVVYAISDKPMSDEEWSKRHVTPH